MLRPLVQPFSSFCALWWCLLLPQLCLLFNHLRSSSFSPFSTGFCHFRIFHTSLSPIFHTSLSPIFLRKLMRFLILSFISFTWWNLWAKRRKFYCLFFYRLLLIIIRQYFSAYINAGTSSLSPPWVQRFSSFLRPSVLPPAAATLPSVQPPTFVGFLYWLLSLLYFSHFAITYLSYFVVTCFS